MSAAQQFCEKWFPLSVMFDGEKYPIEWFHTRGVVRLLGQFVVTVYPDAGHQIREPFNPKTPLAYRSVLAYGWSGLIVKVVEHGVGAIDEQCFEFEAHLQSRRPTGGLVLAVSHTPAALFSRMGVIDSRLGGTPNPDPELYWHVYEPVDTRELLDPMERYIAHWL